MQNDDNKSNNGGMTLNEYQQLARRTTTSHLTMEERVERSNLPHLKEALEAGCTGKAKFAVESAVRQQLERNDISCAALGIAGEAGEVADLVKKAIYHGHALDDAMIAKMKLELGDVLWYLAELATLFGFTLEDIARANDEKLRARYKDGFSSRASIKRNE